MRLLIILEHEEDGEEGNVDIVHIEPITDTRDEDSVNDRYTELIVKDGYTLNLLRYHSLIEWDTDGQTKAVLHSNKDAAENKLITNL